MKVMCIIEGDKNLPAWPIVGEMYTVIEAMPHYKLVWGSNRSDIYYILAEMGEEYCYNSRLFAPLSDIDETELINEKAEELV